MSAVPSFATTHAFYTPAPSLTNPEKFAHNQIDQGWSIFEYPGPVREPHGLQGKLGTRGQRLHSIGPVGSTIGRSDEQDTSYPHRTILHKAPTTNQTPGKLYQELPGIIITGTTMRSGQHRPDSDQDNYHPTDPIRLRTPLTRTRYPQTRDRF
ncbi:hypothetical protein Hypma_011317 [Hypsizygus marmoreus]|uniref:Uncharacterized protein n=1 Tax=Hypsizygus marmoreus TaxID=39966 RepID=A0A369JI08_HYPMA|nr:hypothetical protein Hypma_011317 [Hypsizygus marmoreus]